MQVDADLHLHGYYSGGVSDRMKLPVMAEQSDIKGLDLVGTGDILNPEWREHVRDETRATGDGIYRMDDRRFLLSTEVEDKNRVHHILLFPHFEAVESVYRAFADHSSDIDREGRPRLDCGGEEIVKVAKDHGCLVGPAHAFTPYTALYGHHDSLQDCYGEQTRNIDFLELGLSADTAFADRISDHNDITFLSNSDAHSPWPHRMGREFNRLQVDELAFDEVRKALHRHSGRGVELNAGFDPQEGKYHCTACQDCHQKYTQEQAERFDWTCQDCGKSIKQGVKDRIAELDDGGASPDWRPDYLHTVPLAEIIQHVVGHSSPTTKKVQSLYDRFLDAFDSEIGILVDQDIDELRDINGQVADAVRLFREEKTIMVPGGGGSYGELIIPRDEDERERILANRAAELDCRYDNSQRSLDDF
ncbi:MAG: TIGR00375 family protein [Candidatus Nanohaloarchaea archaeon]|nr:TIGR00375 family protein [Candidatus Nanohaloarchaea archaeon]